MDEMDNVYKITADYRPRNPNKPKYYAVAKTEREAKKKFMAKISWLKVYSCDLLDESTAGNIVSHPEKHIIIEG